MPSWWNAWYYFALLLIQRVVSVCNGRLHFSLWYPVVCGKLVKSMVRFCVAECMVLLCFASHSALCICLQWSSTQAHTHTHTHTHTPEPHTWPSTSTTTTAASAVWTCANMSCGSSSTLVGSRPCSGQGGSEGCVRGRRRRAVREGGGRWM